MNLIKRYSILIYFILTLTISWTAIIALIGSSRLFGSASQTEAIPPSMFMAMYAGPTIAGLLLTGLVFGKKGFKTLVSRLTKWRVAAKWYVIASLTAPFSMLAVLIPLSLTSSEFPPGIMMSNDKVSLLFTGIVAGLFTGIFEELGWSGFVIPQLRKKYRILSTGIIVGLVWGLWHLPPFWGVALANKEVAPTLYLMVLLFSFLPAFRVLMVWVYDRTKSLFITMLMHAGLTAGTLILQPSVTGLQGVTYNLSFAGILWLLVILVFLSKYNLQKNLK